MDSCRITESRFLFYAFLKTINERNCNRETVAVCSCILLQAAKSSRKPLPQVLVDAAPAINPAVEQAGCVVPLSEERKAHASGQDAAEEKLLHRSL
jgi:hypothetical protein